nr:iq domain-containing protein iqm3 [Quercus suber]
MALSVDCHDHNPESMSMDSQKSKEIFVSTAAVGKGLYQDAKAQKLAFQHWIEAVGKGLYQDAKAQKLAFQHWIEAIDPRHRYGHNLNFYYEEWGKGDTEQPFFHWLDVGDGKDVDLKDCPRSRLRQECIKYLGLEGPLWLLEDLRQKVASSSQYRHTVDITDQLRRTLAAS